MVDLQPLAYGLSITVVVLFGIGAIILTRRRQNVMKHDTEFFLTARKSVSEFTVAWSFYSSGVGAW
jgi:SSS family solute:Na+ symporter